MLMHFDCKTTLVYQCLDICACAISNQAGKPAKSLFLASKKVLVSVLPTPLKVLIVS